MAKGQKRSTREIRKPKKDRTIVAAPPPVGAQVKMAGGNVSAFSKKK